MHTDSSLSLTDVKVLNSTSVKVSLSNKTSTGVIEISDSNHHVWRQVKPDKDGIITALEPAKNYFLRITEGTRAGPPLQIFLPAEVVKLNATNKVAS